MEVLHQTDGHISGWVSEEDARHVREASMMGHISDLQAIKKERSQFPKYLRMVSWVSHEVPLREWLLAASGNHACPVATVIRINAACSTHTEACRGSSTTVADSA